MKTLQDVQTRALALLPEVRRTIRDRMKIVEDRPETAAALEPRIADLQSLATLLHELSFITYAEGDPPTTPTTNAPRS